MNKIILVGRVGSEPVRRETKNGTSVTNFSVATSRRMATEELDENGRPKEETQWHQIVAWGKQGDSCASYLHKGSAVLIEGSLKSRKYEGKDGSKKMSFEIHAETVNFLGQKRNETTEALAS